MPHNYKNYAHLEGVLDEDAVVSTSKKGEVIVAFKLSVRENGRGPNGEVIKHISIFTVEVGQEFARYVGSLKKGTHVFIDATIRIRNSNVDGIEQVTYVLKAHRVYGIDYGVGKMELKDTPNATKSRPNSEGGSEL